LTRVSLQGGRTAGTSGWWLAASCSLASNCTPTHDKPAVSLAAIVARQGSREPARQARSFSVASAHIWQPG
jgi:hypothetical protein